MKNNIRKVKRYQKPLICLIGILIFVLGMTVEKIMKANADEINYEYESNSIDYDNSTSNLNATNVKEAIDELYEKVGQCPDNMYCYNMNRSYVKAYTYDESTCITGDETGCVETTCYENGSCPVGTIIDYLVNNTTIVRFHVLHDDGDTMTMQSQKNTLYNVAWWSGGNDSTKGPQIVMKTLKKATDSWTNVNPITITSGTTSFVGVDSIDNICTHNNGAVSCSGNLYDIGLIAGTYRARIITTQEATDQNVGQCLKDISDSKTNHKSCRMFMNNYSYAVKQSEYCRNVELCVNDDHHENGGDHNWGYWTMGTYSSSEAWFVNRVGNVGGYGTPHINFGARAVIVVDK